VNIDQTIKFFESDGGKTATVIVLMIFFAVLAALMHMTHHDPGQTGISLLSGTFSALLTLMIARLGTKKNAE